MCIATCTAEDAEVWSVSELLGLLHQIETEIVVRPNRVRHEMNGAGVERGYLEVMATLGGIEVTSGAVADALGKTTTRVAQTRAGRVGGGYERLFSKAWLMVAVLLYTTASRTHDDKENTR